MKKILTLAVLFIMVFSLNWCGNASNIPSLEEIKTQYYTDDEIEQALNCVKREEEVYKMMTTDKILTGRQGRILLVANVSKEHIRKFYIPFFELIKKNGWMIDVACRLDVPVPECDHAFDLPCDRNPFCGEY